MRKQFLLALRQPALLAQHDQRAWQHLLALGRVHAVSGRWHAQLEALALLPQVPTPVRRHLWSDHCVASAHERRARWEINRLSRVLNPTDIPWALLKGAAYLAADLPSARGRLLADVDVLVPRAELGRVERLLHQQGWHDTPHSAYDDRYYREWMHELPPLQHGTRGTTLDVHHTLLPLTDPLHPDGSELLSRRVVANGETCVLAPADLVLHSVLHGFHAGDLQHCLRDVLDVYELVTHFVLQSGDAFWISLVDRALRLRAVRALRIALSQAEGHFELAVPLFVKHELRQADRGLTPLALLAQLMNQLVVPALPPARMSRVAHRVLSVRSHLLKMPLRRLLPHALHKTWQKWRPATDAAPAAVVK